MRKSVKFKEAEAEDDETPVKVKVSWKTEQFMSIKSTLFMQPWPAILENEEGAEFGMKAFFLGDEQDEDDHPGVFRMCCQKLTALKLMILALNKELQQEQVENTVSPQREWIAGRFEVIELGSARESETFSLYVPVRTSLTGATMWVKIMATWESCVTL